MQRPGVEPATSRSRVRHANHYTTKPPLFYAGRVCSEQAKQRVPLKLEQQLTIVKLQMFNENFNKADEEKKGGVTVTQFRQAVRETIGDHVTDDDVDMVFMKVDTYNAGIVNWEVRLYSTCLHHHHHHHPELDMGHF